MVYLGCCRCSAQSEAKSHSIHSPLAGWSSLARTNGDAPAALQHPQGFGPAEMHKQERTYENGKQIGERAPKGQGVRSDATMHLKVRAGAIRAQLALAVEREQT